MRQNAAHRRRMAAFSASPTKTFLRPSTSHLSLLLLLLSFIFVFVFGWARVEAFPFGGGEQLRRFRKALNNNDSADELDHPSSITRVSEPPPTTDHLITEVAFDLGRRYTGPKYAFITSGSYKRFVHEMKEKCRTTTDGNIAEIRLNTFDYDYFRWEELEFNKALVRTLFPETVKRRDYGRFMNASRSIRQIRLDELENRCLQKARDEDWDAVLDEKTRFEDFLINTILPMSRIAKKSSRRQRSRLKSSKFMTLPPPTSAHNSTDLVAEEEALFNATSGEIGEDASLAEQLLLLDTQMGGG